MRYLIFLLVLLIGCVRVPSKEEAQNADYGEYPANYQELVHAHIREYFKDPNSVIDLEIQQPEKSWFAEHAKTTYGYKVVFRCNAKNSYGGYGGWKTYYLLVRNGVVRDITYHVELYQRLHQ